MGAGNVQRGIGRIKAMVQSCCLEGAYEDSWERFVKHQKVLPDQTKFWQAITNELQAKTGYEPVA